MSASQLIQDLAHALEVFLSLDEDREIDVWDRLAPLNVAEPAHSLWASMPCVDSPPAAFVLMVRTQDDERFYELLWKVEGEPEDAWPVVEVSEDGEAQVLAANLSDWLDAVLFTCGRLGGGAEEDLQAARDEATAAAQSLADDLTIELDRHLASAERMGDRWEEAQETWGDAWADAVEGIES